MKQEYLNNVIDYFHQYEEFNFEHSTIFIKFLESIKNSEDYYYVMNTFSIILNLNMNKNSESYKKLKNFNDFFYNIRIFYEFYEDFDFIEKTDKNLKKIFTSEYFKILKKNKSFIKNNVEFQKGDCIHFCSNYIINLYYENLLYYKIGEKKSLKKAIKYLKKFVNYEQIPNMIGLSYDKLENYKKAVYYYKLGVKNDDPDAMFNLGHLYLSGIYVEKDKEKAISLFEKSYKLGDEDSENELIKLGVLSNNNIVDKNKVMNIDKKEIFNEEVFLNNVKSLNDSKKYSILIDYIKSNFKNIISENTKIECLYILCNIYFRKLYENSNNSTDTNIIIEEEYIKGKFYISILKQYKKIQIYDLLADIYMYDFNLSFKTQNKTKAIKYLVKAYNKGSIYAKDKLEKMLEYYQVFK